MIILLIILIVAAIGGAAAYVVMQYADVDTKVPSSSSGFHSGYTERRGGTVAERIANTPSGCLVAVLIVVAVWLALWLVVLILGLRVLTA